MRETKRCRFFKKKYYGIDHSLKRLGLDYVDLYQIHRLDHETPMEDIMEALHDVVKSGKARYIGASVMWAWEFERLNQIAERNGWTKLVSMQNQVTVLNGFQCMSAGGLTIEDNTMISLNCTIATNNHDFL